MIYQVRWKRTRAARELERRMKNDAHDLGESRSGDERIAFQSPLAAVFEVEPEHAVVRVLQVWPY